MANYIFDNAAERETQQRFSSLESLYDPLTTRHLVATGIGPGWLEMRARAGASEAIRALMDLAPPKANVLRDGKELEVPTAEIITGDTVVIRPGNKIPVDGTVSE